VVRRIGGEMNISNHAEGGARVNIRLPLQKLKTE